MAFSVQVIRYGWVALASLGVITGATIYVANNQRHQVKPQDIIEITLGTYERCLATQTSTNPTYSVTPPSFVRTWTSNVYTTNGVTVYTNIVTNTIGWHIDRDMMISLDTTIKALVPYYVDTNTVYDGTTNIVTLTVTGLWASLGIGDRTNKFTREPCWTNPVSTAATYGDYPWQIYAEDLQERYKVLNALKYSVIDRNEYFRIYKIDGIVRICNSFAQPYLEFQNVVYNIKESTVEGWGSASWQDYDNYLRPWLFGAKHYPESINHVERERCSFDYAFGNTSLNCDYEVHFRFENWLSSIGPFQNFGDYNVSEGQYCKVSSGQLDGSGIISNIYGGNFEYMPDLQGNYFASAFKVIFKWHDFQYCTNKYW
jgi:hypothetical protein